MYKLSLREVGEIMVVDIEGAFLKDAAWNLVDFINLLVRKKKLRVLVNLEKAGPLDEVSLGAIGYGYLETTERGGKFAVVGNSSFRELHLKSKAAITLQDFDSEKEAIAWFRGA
jgi:hypothetical protein